MTQYRVNSDRLSEIGKAGDVVKLEDPVQAARLLAGGFITRLAGGKLLTSDDVSEGRSLLPAAPRDSGGAGNATGSDPE